MNAKFYDANKRLEKYLAEIDEQVGNMTGFMAQLEDLHQQIVNVLQLVPMSDRTPVEQWILEQLIGDAAND